MWADDPNANVIMAYIEGVPSGREFIDTARLASKKKPIVAVKSGVTQAGSRAVSSHTGSLAGSEQAYAAAFKQAGIIRAHTMEQLFDFARAFAYQPLLKGDRIAIITNAGGPGILATDAIERSGLKIARFDNETIKKLESYLPDAASAANPVDVLGDAAGDRYEYAIDVVSQDPNVDGILVVLTPQALTDIVGTAEAVANLCERVDIPVLAVFMGEGSAEGHRRADRARRPTTPSPSGCCSAACHGRLPDRPCEPLPEYEEIDVDREAVSRSSKVRSEGVFRLATSRRGPFSSLRL